MTSRVGYRRIDMRGRYLFVLVSLLCGLNSEAMEDYIAGRHNFVEGDYSRCVKQMSDIVIKNTSIVAMYAKIFLYMFFQKMKEENSELNLAKEVDSVVNSISEKEVTPAHKQSLSLTATSRGKLLLENDRLIQAKRWLSTAHDLDKSNMDAVYYLQDIEGVTQPQNSTSSLLEGIDLDD